MTRWLRSLLILGLMLGMLAPSVASAQTGRFFLQPVGDNNEAITSGRCRVVTAGTSTLLTIYDSSTLTTSKTNPTALDTTTGVCDWYLSSLTATVDVWLYVDGGPYKGARVRLDAITRTSSKLVRISRSQAMKVLSIPFPSAASTTATLDGSGRSIPPGGLLTRVLLETTTAVAASTFNVGIGGTGVTGIGNDNEVNLCSAVTTAAVGVANCNPTAILNSANTAGGFSSTAGRFIRLHNQNHATVGFVHVFYVDGGYEP